MAHTAVAEAAQVSQTKSTKMVGCYVDKCHSMAIMNDVTVVFTSCGRQDLLDISLATFFKFNTYHNIDVIVVEDGPGRLNWELARKYANRSIAWLSTGSHVGQIRAIDFAYSHIRTPYIFHTEDDWKFHACGFIERSFAILLARPDCLMVKVQPPNELIGHPTDSVEQVTDGVTYKKLQFDFELGDRERYVWHGFSFNPGLRRLKDYQRIAPYTKHRAGTALRSEEALGKIYRAMGFYVVVLTTNSGCGYVRHIGWGRHVHDPLPLLYRIRRRIGRTWKGFC
jgi:hypothetical protein